MTKNYLAILALLTAVFLFASCEKDDPEEVNEEEVITTMNYMLVPSDGGAMITMSFRDLDGDGANAPVITGGTLASNLTYTGTLELLNEAESPAEDITEEVQEEDDEHQFFFQSTVPNLSVTYNDQDADGNPVGLSTTVTTGAAGSGMLTVILKHEPSKSASGVADGNIENAGGETDIEVAFPVDVQ